MQIINVCLGGTLHQDIVHLYANNIIPRFMTARKKIRALPKLTLPSWLPKNWKVNSLHHQAIDQLGQDVEVCATEFNGLPQMIRVVETDNKVLGVQWHP